MKKLRLLTVGMLLGLSSSFVFAGGALHSEHKGKNHANHTGSSGVACKEVRVGQFKPVALSEVAPGSEFSFTLFDAVSPNNLEVTVKKIAVPVSFEKKGELTIVKGSLPDSLKDTAARIVVKIKGKLPKCNTEEGWLVKILPS